MVDFNPTRWYKETMMNEENTMNISTVLSRMHTFARTTKDDVASNEVARAADRLAHQGSFEAPLTNAEIAIISRFMTA